MEATETEVTTLDKFAIGSRLLIRSRVDWRFASVSKVSEERVVLTVCSPSGRTYRLRRDLDTQVILEGSIPFLTVETGECWRDNFSSYDIRW